MSIRLYPTKPRGSIILPTSKSESHRIIIAAALAKGITDVYGLKVSKDIKMTMRAVEKLGAKIVEIEDGISIHGGIDFSSIPKVIDCHESGSTLRFLIPISTIFQLKTKFIGSPQLFKRPLGEYKKIYNNLGIDFVQEVDSLFIDGELVSGEYHIDGGYSSQFISGLLMALPLLPDDSIIHVTGELESLSYVKMTMEVLKAFKINVEYVDNKFMIPGNQHYRSLFEPWHLGVDYSQFAFFAVLGIINSNEIRVRAFEPKIEQGDKVILQIIIDLGGKYRQIDNVYIFDEMKLKGGEIDLKDCPDLGPILMVLALFGSEPIHFTNIRRLRYKECDRIEAMRINLQKCGALMEINENDMTIFPSLLHAPDEAFDPFNDHRIFMSLAILATTFDQPTIILNHQCIDKSYPDFLEDLKKAYIRWEYVE